MNDTAEVAGLNLPRLLRGPLPVLVLLVCHVALGLSAALRESLTFDEGVHLTGGLCYWTAGDYRLHPENGNWPQRWASLPLWLGGCNFPPREGRAWRESDLWENSDRLLYESGNDSTDMLRRARTMMAVPSVLLGLLIYGLARYGFGPLGALVSLTLYTFSPTFLANSFLATSDLFATLFFLAASCAIWKLLDHITPTSIALAGMSVAGLLLSKFSGVLIVPIAAVLAGIRLTDPQPLRISLRGTRSVVGLGRQFAVLSSVALIEIALVTSIIWGSYGFRYSAFAPGSEAESRFQVDWPDVQKGLPGWFGRSVQLERDYHLLPEAHLFGFAFTIFTSARFGFLNGECSEAGWISYFPYTLAVKTPLAVFLLLALGTWGYWLRRKTADPNAENATGAARPPRLYEPLFVLLGVYGLFALESSLNIGHRHILPTYPPLFILAGSVAVWFQPWLASQQTKRAAQGRAATASSQPPKRQVVHAVRIVVAISLAICVAEALWFWPHYLAYFNVLAGGPRHGYRHLVDSSLDWGQDLTTLKRWLDDHPADSQNPRHVYLSYFGMARPEYYGIDAQMLPGFRPRWDPHVPKPLTAGLYCVSATMVQSVYLKFPGRWNVAYERGYRELRSVFETLAAAGADLAAYQRAVPHLSEDDLQMALRNYEDLRFGRLCSFLRKREPDAEVGYSILIYRLTQADIDRALRGEPAELLPQPETTD